MSAYTSYLWFYPSLTASTGRFESAATDKVHFPLFSQSLSVRSPPNNLTRNAINRRKATLLIRVTAVTLTTPLISPNDHWGTWAALFATAAVGTCVAVNYVAVSEALGLSSSVFAAGMAVDNVMCAIYFMLLFALASKIPVESADDNVVTEHKEKTKRHGLQSAAAIAVSFTICKASSILSKHFDFLGGTLPCATAITVILATLFPTKCGYLAPAGEAIALILMQVFFVVIGANGSIPSVINTAPCIFTFAFVQLSVHLAVVLGVGKLLKIDKKTLLIASNANIGGPTTACGMATAKGWNSLNIPALLAGIFGISIATFLGIGMGLFVLRHL